MPDWSGTAVLEALGLHLQSTWAAESFGEGAWAGPGHRLGEAAAGAAPGALSGPAGSCCASRTGSCPPRDSTGPAQQARAGTAFLTSLQPQGLFWQAWLAFSLRRHPRELGEVCRGDPGGAEQRAAGTAASLAPAHTDLSLSPYLCGGTLRLSTAFGAKEYFQIWYGKDCLGALVPSPQQPRVIISSHFSQRLIILILTFLPSFYSPAAIPSSIFQPIPMLDHSCYGFVAGSPARSSEPRGAGRTHPSVVRDRTVRGR